MTMPSWVTVAHPTWMLPLMLLCVAVSVWTGYRTKQWGSTLMLVGIAVTIFAPNVVLGTLGFVVGVAGVALSARDARRTR